MSPAARTLACAGLVTLGAAAGAWARGAAPPRAGQEPHPVERDGHWWLALSAREQDAYLTGFVTGAALVQARRDAEAEPELDALDALVRAKRRAGELEFAYAPHVYGARLRDYYFYVDRRDRTLLRVMAELNDAIRRRGR